MNSFNLDLTSPEEVSAGDTESYYVEFDSTGADAGADDALRVDIPTETVCDALGTPCDSVVWDDDEDLAIDGDLLDDLPVRGNTLIF